MKYFNFKTLLTGAALVALSAPAVAQYDNDKLGMYEDGANIVLSGTVQNLKEESFRLNYGENTIEVSLEDWDWWETDANDLRTYLNNGDTIVVSGELDDNWFTDREIDANNLYVSKDYTYYYVKDTNPAYYQMIDKSKTMREGSHVSLRGTVQDISGREFTLKTQNREMQVDTAELLDNPFDDQGTLKLKKNDRVLVYGEVDDAFFDGKEVSADALVKISKVQDRQNRKSAGKNQNR